MSDYTVSTSICDYMTLQFKDATVVSDSYIWNIPNTYYSNRRSPVSQVCLADAQIVTGDQHALAVVWMGSSQNQYNTANDGAFMGTLQNFRVVGAENYYELRKSKTIDILTSARPSTIRIKLVDATNVTVPLTIDANNGGQLVLKFKYLDPQQVTRDFVSTQYGNPKNF